MRVFARWVKRPFDVPMGFSISAKTGRQKQRFNRYLPRSGVVLRFGEA
jgi:hypothetical protein